MAKMERKSFDTPEETRTVDKGKLDVVKLGDVTAMRARFEPGWRWSECVMPIAGTASCQVAHLMHGLTGFASSRSPPHGAWNGWRPPAVRSSESCWIFGSWTRAGTDMERSPADPSSPLLARSVYLVELPPACSTAPCRRNRSATL